MRVQLRDLYLDLEGLVEERTTELSNANEKLRGEIAERMKTEAERRTLEVKALAHSKLATLGEVATGVAHEVNQPLTFINTMIQGFQEDLELGDLDEEALKKRLAQAVRQVERINSIVTHLRTFGRADEEEMTEVSLETVLDNTLLLLGESLRLRDVRVDRRVVQGLPVILGSANQLEQVFINLIQNSFDAFPDGKEDATVTVGLDWSEKGTTVKVTFSDNGVGIAPAHLERIYEPFFTTKEVGQGTGLGLSIVYGIVADHSGTIECQSEYTKGTTFTLILPVAGV
jgi:C4-dicarboxylate-specific signal transduction histidine kinase